MTIVTEPITSLPVAIALSGSEYFPLVQGGTTKRALISSISLAATPPAGANTQLQYNNSGVLGASPNLTWVSPILTIGVAGAATGQLAMTGSGSGTITIQGQTSAGTYNFNLPTSSGTSGQPLLSGGGGSNPMTFGTLGIGAGGTGLTNGNSGGVLAFTASGTIASSAALVLGAIVLGGGAGAVPSTSSNFTTSGSTLTLGVATSATGALALAGSTSGTVTVQPANAAGTWSLTLPTTSGSANYFLQTNGSGVTTWASAVVAAAGSNTQVQYNSSGAFAASAGFVFDGTSQVTLGVGGSSLGKMVLSGNTSGSTTLQPSATASGTITFPAATDTVTLLATSQALTNKTYNGLTVTTSTGTLTITNGKTLSASNSITLAGVDGKTLTTNNSITLAGTDGKSLTLTNGLSVTTNDGTISFGAVSKTLTINNSVAFSGTDGTTMTFPGVSDTVACIATAQTFTKTQTITPSSGNGVTINEVAGGSAINLVGATQTASNPVILATQTWNNGAVTFTGFKLNVTNTASQSGSPLIDLQVGGSSQFSIDTSGNLRLGGATTTYFASDSSQYYFYSAGFASSQVSFRLSATGTDLCCSSTSTFSFTNGTATSGTRDTFLSRAAAASLQFGSFDSSSPVAQTLQFQSSNSANVAGVNATIIGSKSAGSGASGKLIFKTGATGASSGTTNTTVTALTLTNATTNNTNVGYPSVVVGAGAALAANATDGFLYFPTCAGTPTGTPTSQTGAAPIVLDTTNVKIWMYTGGAWKGVTIA